MKHAKSFAKRTTSNGFKSTVSTLMTGWPTPGGPAPFSISIERVSI
ncbi:hypothetical protein PbDSM24746_55230 [Paenibacillus macerans]|nr:hypothetical protein PbDSM24746_55230 [Paenibacillus macerans]GBK72229.1 hypothetical protein PbJCM17693_59370 [Paenibacillus macerans]GIP13894.1 hypothetical protein J1TS5_60640 [Paenibacillus macerans]